MATDCCRQIVPARRPAERAPARVRRVAVVAPRRTRARACHVSAVTAQRSDRDTVTPRRRDFTLLSLLVRWSSLQTTQYRSSV